MWFASALALAVSVSPALAHPQASYVVHEKRDTLPHAWEFQSPADPSATVLAKIGLAQSNLDDGHDHLIAVSDPRSPKYGQHWTAAQIAEFFQPSAETIESVQKWLIDAGIDSKRIKLSKGKHWISFSATIEELQNLLQTDYGVYRHQSGRAYIGSESYRVPASLKHHIDFITPTVQFDAAIKVTANAKRDTAVESISTGPRVNGLMHPDLVTNDNLSNCGDQITPDCLRAMYEIPKGQFNDSQNSYGVVEFAPQAYSQADLDLFFNTYTEVPAGTSPVYLPIDGGYLATGDDSSTLGESNLDLEFAMSLVYPQPVLLYQTGDDVLFQPATNNNFLDAVDGSYCTYDGGDNPDWDAIYPHNFSATGYQGQPDCGIYKPASVISVSYGMNEASHPPAYFRRQCYEYMKLGLMGVTLLFSSGDSGVAGLRSQCLNPDGSYTPVSSDFGIFNPMFPGTCPYITSVGGTGLDSNVPVNTPESAAPFSSGGFSNLFSIPDYQKEAIAHYYAEHAPPYNSSVYNNTQLVRGFPDVSANGVNFSVSINGTFFSIAGTSASSPVFGAVVALLNGVRLRLGKSPIGFINPVLYQHPEVLNDITSGHNGGCGTDGFAAVEGWDPVTGLGTPNYPMMEALFASLP
ncbi:peptidase S8/S53 domain-containing protein [Xylogone sp. PMI_703]|nr:peptidase S8/S53 domain-containing protein [Xylogone sp. PMI_703]